MLIRKITLTLICLFIFGIAKAEPVFKDTEGNAVQLSSLKGKWIVVNYWASWCPTCLAEIPELNTFYKKHQNKNVAIYSVNYDPQSLASLKMAVRKARIKFPTLSVDPNSAWHLGQIDAVPTTFIINPKGKVVKKLVGETTEAELTRAMNSLHTV